MRGDLLQRGFQVAPQEPAVHDLNHRRVALECGPSEIARTGPADHPHCWMRAQPRRHRRDLPVGQYVDAPTGFGVDDDRGVEVAFEQGELVDSDAPWNLVRGQRNPYQAVERATQLGTWYSAASSRAPAEAAKAPVMASITDATPVSAADTAPSTRRLLNGRDSWDRPGSLDDDRSAPTPLQQLAAHSAGSGGICPGSVTPLVAGRLAVLM
nr:hypothetical protein [Streptomyces sp. N35]